MTDTAHPVAPPPADPPAPSAGDEAGASTPVAVEERREGLRAGIRSIRVGSAGLFRERTLMVVGGVIAPLGLVAILLGWYGTSRTVNTFEQTPYVVSGGLLGLALVFLGSFLYFAHWMTELVREQRVQSEAVLDALRDLRDELGGRVAVPPPAGEAPSNGAAPTGLVATDRGSLAHRPSCTVVVGKTGLRPVDVDDGLDPCKLCDPFEGP